MKIDWNKPIQTRDGLKARLLTILKGRAGRQTHLVVVTMGSHEGGPFETSYTVSEAGESDSYSGRDDIIQVPEPGKDWTPVSTPPSNSRTVLCCSSPALIGDDCTNGWFGYYSVGSWWTALNNRGVRTPGYWRNLP
jgi:hypothetical protein